MIKPEDRHVIAEMLRSEGFTDALKDKVLDVLDIDVPDADDIDLACCLADLVDQPAPASEAGSTTQMRNLGDYIPRHKFRRMQCENCGAVHWEQPNDSLRMPYCPYCRKKVTGHND